MQKKIIAACVSLVAFAAMAVVPAIASASPQLFETVNGVPTALATGAKIQGTNTTNIVFNSSVDVTCTSSVLTGEVKTNSGKLIEGTITSATYTGTGSGGACTSSLGDFTVTTEIATTDWCIKASSSDKFTAQAGACGTAAKALNFILESGSLVCKYQREASKPVGGTHSTGEGATGHGILTFTPSESSFTQIEGGFLCPGSGELEGSYKLETDNTNIPVYIN